MTNRLTLQNVDKTMRTQIMNTVSPRVLERIALAICCTWLSIISPQVNAASKPKTLKPPEMIVYSDDKHSTTYSMADKNKAIDDLFSAKGNENPSAQSQPVMIYIHGRALGHRRNGYDEEPGESKKDVLPGLFSQYRPSKVLMFHWPHWGNGNDYSSPAEDAKSAGAALTDLLAEIDRAAKEKKLSGP